MAESIRDNFGIATHDRAEIMTILGTSPKLESPSRNHWVINPHRKWRESYVATKYEWRGGAEHLKKRFGGK
jgi:hypothetical protein